MVQPEGFVIPGKEKKVYWLKKALYGLKQASLAWNKQAHSSLVKLDFTRCLSDTGVYIHRHGRRYVIVILYVDDVLFIGNDKKHTLLKKSEFMKIWECRDLGEAKEFLGMRITRNRKHKSIKLDQIDYAKKVVKRFGMTNAKPVRTPLPAGYTPEKNIANEDPKLKNLYQQVIGSLLYLMLGTRPDISHAVILMSGFASNPTPLHLQKALHIVKYVNSTLDMCIHYQGKSQRGFEAYSDSDWANNPEDRKSITGYFISLAKGPVSWVSRKQKSVALSPTEAEYMALSDTS